MSDLESGIVTIIRVFHKYSGDKCKLKKAELINNDISDFMMKIHENETLDELFVELDQNGDLEINLKEFIAMVTSAKNSRTLHTKLP